MSGETGGTPPPKPQGKYESDVGIERIRELLSFIPPTLSYLDRLKINTAIMGEHGVEAVPLLKDHWQVDDLKKLERDLEYQLRIAVPGWMGVVYKEARKHGWKPPSSTRQRSQKAVPSAHVFEARHSVQEGGRLIRAKIAEFFTTRKSMVLRASTGLGKTTKLFRYIAENVADANILILFPNHRLADEQKQVLDGLIKAQKRERSPMPISPLTQKVEGKMRKCELVRDLKAIAAKGQEIDAEKAKARLASFSKSAPTTTFCLKNCPYGGECHYTLQGNSLANIRIGVTVDLSNEPGAFRDGITEDEYRNAQPKKERSWKPDFIVVDESILHFEEEVITSKCEIASLRLVLASMTKGADPVQAIEQNRAVILADKKIDWNATDAPTSGRSTLSFCQSYLAGRIDEKTVSAALRATNDSLVLKRLRPIHDHYRGLPMLVLDATADEPFVSAVLPDAEFFSIQVKSNPDVKVYQVQNFAGSKDVFENPEKCEKAVKNLKAITDKAKSEGKTIGVITYKSLKTQNNFPAYISNMIGADKYGHFGAIKGTNDFENVDCLVIFGRHHIGDDGLKQIAQAVFGDPVSTAKEYKDMPYLMKDGTSMQLTNLAYTDEKMQATYNQFCVAETVQAVGRGRLVHGSKKEIYIFSNQSLGGNVEIDGFFDFDHGEPNNGLLFDIPDDLNAIELKRASLLKIGISDHHIKTNLELIEACFQSNGFSKFNVEYKDNNYKKRSKTILAKSEKHAIETIDNECKIIAVTT